MGPPEFTGGNGGVHDVRSVGSPAASMGPPEFTGGNFVENELLPFLGALQWGRRNSPAETRGRAASGWRAARRFNGAAGIHRRKLETRAEILRAHSRPLQWGRRNSPAETQVYWDHQQTPNHASMGPPEFTGGNMPWRTILLRTQGSLQWGRRNSPAETPTNEKRPGAITSGFNGAAGIHRRKPFDWRWWKAQGIAGFNGAAGIHRRKPAAPALRHCRAL